MTADPDRPCTRCGKPRDMQHARCRACRAAYQREYAARPEVRARSHEYNRRPEIRERKRAYKRTPKAIKRRLDLRRSAEARARRRQEYRERPEVRDGVLAYYRAPAVKARRNARRRELGRTPEGRLRGQVRNAVKRLRRAAGKPSEPWLAATVILLRCRLARLIEANRPDLRGLIDPADPTLTLAPHRGGEVA